MLNEQSIGCLGSINTPVLLCDSMFRSIPDLVLDGVGRFMRDFEIGVYNRFEEEATAIDAYTVANVHNYF
ncbi:hypothetical protein ECANGB1_501 [Enterospora canceri]|uniref:Uncharacterized protein n=1 Tax=Enterospora canceri TaxID=1081671 RepID=A0A1Y1S517_9MICR|nr:hypothetical protein ECANGB1_501 [Enterospora canceri]